VRIAANRCVVVKMKGHGTKIIKLVSTSNIAAKGATEGKIGNICYVDDSRTSAYVTKKILKEYGYEVDFFPSAEPAVVAILENDYDLLLTDLTLSTGGMDGDELVRFLRNSGHPRKKLLPVIVITGTSDKETLLKIYEAGANGVLVKPITGEVLHDRIRTLVPEKAYPGTADGYALEIPHASGYSDKLHAPSITPTSITPKSPIDTRIEARSDSLFKSLGIPSSDIPSRGPAQHFAPTPTDKQKKTSASTSNPVKSNKQNKKPKSTKINQQVTQQAIPQTEPQKGPIDATTESPRQQSANKQKSKKLSILENLKLAAAEKIPNLDLNQETEISTSAFVQKTSTAKTSKQHTQPTYKSAARKKKINSKDNIQGMKPAATTAKPPSTPFSPKVNDDTFIEKLRTQAQQIESPPTLPHDDIPVLEPAERDELTYSIDSRGTGAPEIKLEEKTSTTISKERTKRKKPESSPVLEFDAEDVVGDKKIITALDINTDFTEFENDVFKPSFLQSIYDTFRSFRILGLAALVSAVIITWSLWNYINENDLILVDITRVTKGTLHHTINVPGRVVSKLNVNITSSSSGQIVSVMVKEGQKVKKGQSLVKLENEEAISDVKRAEGNLLSAKEETALANKTLKRMRRALTLGAISRQQMEEAEASLKSALAKENMAKESRRTAQLSLDKLSVAAPFGGTVTARYAQVGQWITPSDTLYTLTDLSQIEVEVKVDASDSNSISVGQSVFMSSDASPDKTWTESVRRIATAANKKNNTNTVSVFISLGQDAPSLRMGQQVDAEIRTFSRNNASKLPISAVISRNGKFWVGTIKDGRVHFVPIETGMEDLTHVEVLSGLNSAQEIIIPKGGDLLEGDRVRISNAQTLE